MAYLDAITRLGPGGSPRPQYVGFAAQASAAITAGPWTEAQIVSGGETIVITLTTETWIADITAQRQNIIDGLDSAQSELTGWNNEVRDNEVVTSVVRTSDTVVTITLTAAPSYDITADETITVTVPATALTGAAPLTGTSTVGVTADIPVIADPGTPITNSNATTDVPINYEIDDRTGFRVYPGGLEKDGYGWRTRCKSKDDRHPQEFVRSRGDKQRGSVSPEQDDRFIGAEVPTVTVDDL